MSRIIALNVEVLTRLTYAAVPAFAKRGYRHNYQHWFHRRDWP